MFDFCSVFAWVVFACWEDEDCVGKEGGGRRLEIWENLGGGGRSDVLELKDEGGGGGGGGRFPKLGGGGGGGGKFGRFGKLSEGGGGRLGNPLDPPPPPCLPKFISNIFFAFENSAAFPLIYSFGGRLTG